MLRKSSLSAEVVENDVIVLPIHAGHPLFKDDDPG